MRVTEAWKAALLGILLLGGPTPAQADWTYSVTGLPTSVTRGSTTVSFSPAEHFSWLSDGFQLLALVRTVVPVAAGPATFDTPLSATITLTDGSGTATAAFTGSLSGTTDTPGSVLAITFTGPLQQSGTLDGHPYTISITPYSVLPQMIEQPLGGPITDAIDGRITATIDHGVAIDSLPEPSSLCLACLACLGLVCSRGFPRRRVDFQRVD